MIWGQPWVFDRCQPPSRVFALAQIGRQALGTFLSDGGLVLGQPGAKGQKEEREAVKSNQRIFMLEGDLESIGAQPPLSQTRSQMLSKGSISRGRIPSEQ